MLTTLYLAFGRRYRALRQCKSLSDSLHAIAVWCFGCGEQSAIYHQRLPEGS